MLSSLKNGTILRERYQLTNIVGQGGMGNVYRAEDLRLPGRLCAIKEVHPEPSEDGELKTQAQHQFLKEASILAQLDHPNLPKVSDYFTYKGRDYLVMDYVPGYDLKQILDDSLENGRLLDESLVLAWADQIMDALTYLHNQAPPVLHRDIKPANIKLTPDNRIKLVDFGLVKLLEADDSHTITVVQGRGTVLYTPLEQYGGDSGHTDIRSDIYALGATFYHLVTGSRPPNAKSRFLNPGILKPPHIGNSRVSAIVSEAIMWAMEMHPDKRPSTIEEFRQVLLGHARRPTTNGRSPVSENLAEALRANRMAALITIGLFILAVILTIV